MAGYGLAVRVGSTLAVLSLFCGCYLLKQGGYLIAHQIRAERISRLVSDSTISEKERNFFNEILKIRQFAVDSIGLVRNDNYTRIVRVDSSYLLAMLSAADSASFEVKKWCYPFFGCFPLRSYFDIRDARKAGRRLAHMGYEICIEKVDGYSTLGIFSDPVYSFMVDYPIYTIANYIFHEQTHATVYLKNVQFSEELATFIGREGALSYLRHRFGADSKQYVDAQKSIVDGRTYLHLLKGLTVELDSVYRQPIGRAEKIRLKKGIVGRFRRMLTDKYDSLFITERFRGVEKQSFNNAFLAIHRTYTYDLDLFEKLYEKKNRSLREVVRFAVSLKKSKTDPKESLKKEIGL